MRKERKFPCVLFFLIDDGGNDVAQTRMRLFVFALQPVFQPHHRQSDLLAIA
jgi:hypothetical protein